MPRVSDSITKCVVVSPSLEYVSDVVSKVTAKETSGGRRTVSYGFAEFTNRRSVPNLMMFCGLWFTVEAWI
jgi:hypothetical protein